jgi:hypothetical protein
MDVNTHDYNDRTLLAAARWSLDQLRYESRGALVASALISTGAAAFALWQWSPPLAVIGAVGTAAELTRERLQERCSDDVEPDAEPTENDYDLSDFAQWWEAVCVRSGIAPTPTIAADNDGSPLVERGPVEWESDDRPPRRYVCPDQLSFEVLLPYPTMLATDTFEGQAAALAQAIGAAHVAIIPSHETRQRCSVHVKMARSRLVADLPKIAADVYAAPDWLEDDEPEPTREPTASPHVTPYEAPEPLIHPAYGDIEGTDPIAEGEEGAPGSEWPDTVPAEWSQWEDQPLPFPAPWAPPLAPPTAPALATTTAHERPRNAAPGTGAADVWHALTGADRLLTARELADLTGLAQGSVANLLTGWAREGHAQRLGNGWRSAT